MRFLIALFLSASLVGCSGTIAPRNVSDSIAYSYGSTAGVVASADTILQVRIGQYKSQLATKEELVKWTNINKKVNSMAETAKTALDAASAALAAGDEAGARSKLAIAQQVLFQIDQLMRASGVQ